MNILLLEDEKLAAHQLMGLLKGYFNDAINIEWGQSVQEGLAYLQGNTRPDLIISDIELLDGRVFKLFQQYDVQSPIIFVTAYDQYLLDAFKTNGIAYLLKPYAPEDLKDALDKYLKLFDKGDQSGVSEQVIAQLTRALGSAHQDFKRRFVIKKSNGIYFLATEEIKYFKADDDLVFAFDQKNHKHIISYRMSQLEEVLDDRQFFRINRGEIVNVNYIVKMEAYFGNRLSIQLQGMTEVLKTSGPKTAAFRKWIDSL